MFKHFHKQLYINNILFSKNNDYLFFERKELLEAPLRYKNLLLFIIPQNRFIFDFI